MFFAIPRLFSNSPNRRFPANASRTTSTDQASPTASRDRAIGQTSSFKPLRLMGRNPGSIFFDRGCKMQLLPSVYPASCEMQPGGPKDDGTYPVSGDDFFHWPYGRLVGPSATGGTVQCRAP